MTHNTLSENIDQSLLFKRDFCHFNKILIKEHHADDIFSLIMKFYYRISKVIIIALFFGGI